MGGSITGIVLCGADRRSPEEMENERLRYLSLMHSTPLKRSAA